MREGILEGTAIGGGLLNRGDHYTWVAEIEEIDRVGHLSKIKVKSVSGASKDRLLDILPEWIPTKDIIFRDTPGKEGAE